MGKGEVKRVRERIEEFYRVLFNEGREAVEKQFEVSFDEITQILEEDGWSPESIQVFEEGRDFNEALRLSLDPTRLDGRTTLAPEIQKVVDDLGFLQERARDDIVMQGGETDETRAISDRFLQLQRGEDDSLRGLRDAGFRLLDSGGETDRTRQLTDFGTRVTNDPFTGFEDARRTMRTSADLVAAGGLTPGLQEQMGFGRDLIRERGFTPELMEAAQFMMDQSRLGFEPGSEFRRLFGQLDDIIASGGESAALMPVEQLVGFAREDAARTATNVFRAAQTEAVRRGLSPGPSTVAGGGLDEFANEIADIEARAGREAFASREQLRVASLSDALRNQTSLVGGLTAAQAQQRQQNQAAIADLFRTAAMNLQTGAGLFSGANALASQNLATGIQGVTNLANFGAAREALGVQALGSAEDMVRANLALGGEFLTQELLQRQQAGLNALAVEQLETQRLFGGMSAAANLSINQANTFLGAQAADRNFELQRFNLLGGLFTQNRALDAQIAQNAQMNRLQALGLLPQSVIPFTNMFGTAGGVLGATNQSAFPIIGQGTGFGAFARQLGASALGIGLGWLGGQINPIGGTNGTISGSGNPVATQTPLFNDLGLTNPQR